MDQTLDWDELVAALREELQEQGGLLRLLNQQTETLYRRDGGQNERLEEQIRHQLRLAARRRQGRELALRQTAARLALAEEASAPEVLAAFPDYVRPLLEALFAEVARLSERLSERLRPNQQLKEHFTAEITP